MTCLADLLPSEWGEERAYANLPNTEFSFPAGMGISMQEHKTLAHSRAETKLTQDC
jgi:hypothetical protein